MEIDTNIQSQSQGNLYNSKVTNKSQQNETLFENEINNETKAENNDNSQDKNQELNSSKNKRRTYDIILRVSCDKRNYFKKYYLIKFENAK